ncbi:MAG: DNA polymerase III subunit delta' [Actinomycetes bacterium]
MSSVFDDLIDQEAVIATLKDAVGASKDSTNNTQGMTHSWLFTGPPGSGRSNAAVAFAAALLCEKGGCGVCINCLSVKDGSHADIELIRTEGLSIKVDEVRELITRTSWSPSVGNYRVVVIEDTDRLTESAANALLKVIEEPGARTVWLLCAPSLTDVLPTIRSRCRHLTLRTPSIDAVTKLLIERDGIEPKMAKFASSAAQGHIGRAKFLATNEEARENREKILNIPFTINDLAATFDAAETLVELAKELAKMESEIQDEKEITKLKESYGSTGSKLATGGNKALKELEKEQKSRTTRLVRDNLDHALLDLVTVYRDVLLVQSNSADKITNIDFQNKIIQKAETSPKEIILKSINSILKARNSLSKNSASNLTMEALLLDLKVG